MSKIRITQGQGSQIKIVPSGSLQVSANGALNAPEVKLSTARGERGSVGPSGPPGPTGNSIFITQNTDAASLVTNGINFINTSSISVSIEDSPSGYANVSINTTDNGEKLNIAGGTITGSLNVDSNLHVSGDISLDGNLIIGNVNTDTIIVVADFSSNLTPSTSNTYYLGTDNKQWKEVHVASANVNTINLSGTLVATDASSLQVGGTTSLSTSYISANVVISGPTETTYNVFTTNADSPIVIDSFPSSKFMTVKYIIQSKSIDGYHSTELFCMQDGIETYLTEYATLINNYTLGSYALTISGGVCNLYFNPDNPSRNIITVKLVRTALTT